MADKTSLHSLHQKNLCVKMSNSVLYKVMVTAVNGSASTHRSFQALLDEMDCAYKDIPHYSSVSGG